MLSAMRDVIEWLESLSPWPEEFGLERMWALLDALGDPQNRYRAVHVVGSNGKSTATLTIEALLAAEGLVVGAYLSPHVRSWSERIRVGGEEVEIAAALERVRPDAERVDATQFEVLTAAALAEFAAAEVDVAVVEAGLGGRLDATNVLGARVVLLTNVSLEHTDVLGDTRWDIAREKLAVVRPQATAVLPDDEFAELVGHAEVVIGGAREAAAAVLGHPPASDVEVQLPGRLELRGDEVWDGAHNPAGVAWLVERLPRGPYTIVASILQDKDASAMLARLAPVGSRLVATTSSSPRALPADELAQLARGHFADVEEVSDPREALDLARELGEPVLVTGSLYLLSDLYVSEGEHVR
jgi:dihydrofolate synthase / folylpolyglutamate synthase